MEKWNGRRSSVMSVKGLCSSSQPLASAAGVKILEQGGNAADAAVAMAAALNVCEPCSTGIGGDAFVLYYDAQTKIVRCLMGNGASSHNINLEMLETKGIGFGAGLKPLPPRSGLCISVPGAASCWEDLILRHGKLSLHDVLAPAIDMAENGVPIHSVTADQWSRGLFQGEEANSVFRPNGNSPKVGELFRNPKLANTFRTVASCGAKEGFYKGAIAEAIVQAAQEYGGVLDMNDLESHSTQFVDPISVVYRGYRVFETPPPTHGIAALQALQLMQLVQPNELSSETGTIPRDECRRRGIEKQIHLEIECMRLAYADALTFVCDPNSPRAASEQRLPATAMLTEEYVAERMKLIGETAGIVKSGDPTPFLNSDTVYFCCVDKFGNACSMINSNYMGFGTGISPKGCGFTLHNRGHNVSLDPQHPNALHPRKRPYHTIIPGMITHEDDGQLYCVFGNMGGFMQPMGHFQLVRNLVDRGMSPQEAVDAPRWYIDHVGDSQSDRDLLHSNVILEYGYGGEQDGGSVGDNGLAMMDALAFRGHSVSMVTGTQRALFGRAQVIVRNRDTGVFCGGSDPRADGSAIPVI